MASASQNSHWNSQGLAWLHHECNFLVIHRNIDTNSILLDHYFEPKISNFAKSIISNHDAASLVYPEDSSTDSGLYENGGVWESDFVKKDVYDYGRVALELITGKKTISGSSTSMHKTWLNGLMMLQIAILVVLWMKSLINV